MVSVAGNLNFALGNVNIRHRAATIYEGKRKKRFIILEIFDLFNF